VERWDNRITFGAGHTGRGDYNGGSGGKGDQGMTLLSIPKKGFYGVEESHDRFITGERRRRKKRHRSLLRSDPKKEVNIVEE